MHAHLTALNMIREFDVQVAGVGRTLLDGNRALEGVALLDGEGFLHAEECLLPVGVAVEGRSRNAHGDVAEREVHLEPGHQEVHVVVAVDAQRVLVREVQILLPDLGQIDVQDHAGLAVELLTLHALHKRLVVDPGLDGAHLDPVDLVPPVDFVLIEALVVHGGQVERGAVREHHSVGLHPLVARVQHGVQHGLVEHEVAHPLGNDDVHALDRQRDFLAFALDHGDAVGEAVAFDDVARVLCNVSLFDRVDVLGPGLGREDAQHARAGAHVQDDFVLEKVSVLHYGVLVGQGAHLVLEHLLVDAEVGLGVEVVVRILLVAADLARLRVEAGLQVEAVLVGGADLLDGSGLFHSGV